MSAYSIIMSQDKFPHRDKLHYPYEERGLQFGDGVYEVIRIYDGKYYLLDEHVSRLYRSLQAIKINLPYTNEELTELLYLLLEKNDMKKDGIVYLQITRGSSPREHTFPENAIPNLYAYVKDLPRNLAKLKNGVSTITHPDERWSNCYIKSLNLLPNILARQAAKEKNCHEAILHKDGIVTECSSSNIYLVKGGKIYTYPATKRILHGCVRMRVKEFAADLTIPFIEDSFTIENIETADELFSTSSTSEVMPIILVDGKQVGNGKPGPITRKLQQAYEKDASITSRK